MLVNGLDKLRINAVYLLLAYPFCSLYLSSCNSNSIVTQSPYKFIS